jgi:hypothetical protein
MEPEDIKLLQTIKAMGIKPKTDTPQDSERSMKEYFRQPYTIKVNITNRLKKSKYKI